MQDLDLLDCHDRGTAEMRLDRLFEGLDGRFGGIERGQREQEVWVARGFQHDGDSGRDGFGTRCGGAAGGAGGFGWKGVRWVGELG